MQLIQRSLFLNSWQKKMKVLMYFFIVCGLKIIEMKINVALTKKTLQSSTYGDVHKWGSKNANDGDQRQWIGKDNTWCAHTLAVGTDWWAVNLGKEYHIHGITIYNRGDHHGSNLRDFYIYVYRPGVTVWGNFDIKRGTICYYHNGSAPVVLNVACNERTTGRFVQIYKPADPERDINVLVLCEVEVYSDALTTTEMQLTNKKGRFCNNEEKRSLLSLNKQMYGSSASKCSVLCMSTESCLGFDITLDGTCSLGQTSENVATNDQQTGYFESCYTNLLTYGDRDVLSGTTAEGLRDATGATSQK